MSIVVSLRNLMRSDSDLRIEAITLMVHDTHELWSLHARSKCGQSNTFEKALALLREELGMKTNEQLAEELRERAQYLLDEADKLAGRTTQ